jgi:hypothetical protein
MNRTMKKPARIVRDGAHTVLFLLHAIAAVSKGRSAPGKSLRCTRAHRGKLGRLETVLPYFVGPVRLAAPCWCQRPGSVRSSEYPCRSYGGPGFAFSLYGRERRKKTASKAMLPSSNPRHGFRYDLRPSIRKQAADVVARGRRIGRGLNAQ